MRVRDLAGANGRLSRIAVALLLSGLSVGLGGCPPESTVDSPYIDEGYTDYRKGDLNRQSEGGAPTSILRKFTLQGGDGDKIAIHYGNIFYVSLLQAYINDFADRAADDPNPRREAGLKDVLVLVNVGEAETGGYVAYPSPCGAGPCPSSYNALHCPQPSVGLWSVFYSNDVHENQFLNFANEPVYGPVGYCGRPLRIEVTVIKLNLVDEKPEADTLRATLRKLIAYVQGKTKATFTDAEFRTAAGEIPETIVAQARANRTGMLYSLVLMPPGGVSQLPYPRIEAGNYVLMRNSARSVDGLPWGDLLIDNNTGRLIFSKDANQHTVSYDVPTFFRDRSYVTLQINQLQADQVPPGTSTVPTHDELPPPHRPKHHRHRGDHA